MLKFPGYFARPVLRTIASGSFVAAVLIAPPLAAYTPDELIIQPSELENPAQAADLIYPGETWDVAEDIEALGWSQEKLAAAESYSRENATAAVVIVQGGVVIDQWGEVDRKYLCHSMRKSLLSAMIGVHVASGNIDLNDTLSELGIDDIEPSLTADELSATVRDLIRARSGIYHDACAETASMKQAKPARHSHAPGDHWYYNNWDFNALGSIFMQQTNSDIYEEFDRIIAKPLGMQDYAPADGFLMVVPEESRHGAYRFRMTARDLARFGLLFLREGRWQDKQVVPQRWVSESTRTHSEIGHQSGFGYMWWTSTKDGILGNASMRGSCYFAAGVGGHMVIVIPEHDLVVVHRVNTDKRHSVSTRKIGILLGMILEANGHTAPEDG